MDSILERCERMQARYTPHAEGTPPNTSWRPGTSGSGAKAPGGDKLRPGSAGGATYITLRSSLFFEAPDTGCDQESGHDANGVAGSGQVLTAHLLLPSCPSQQHHYQQEHPPQQQQQQQHLAGLKSASSPSKAAAPTPQGASLSEASPWPKPVTRTAAQAHSLVDLNPGFSFAPGSPQRVAAVAPQLPGVLAQLEQLKCEVHRLDLGRLTHREVLQVMRDTILFLAWFDS